MYLVSVLKAFVNEIYSKNKYDKISHAEKKKITMTKTMRKLRCANIMTFIIMSFFVPFDVIAKLKSRPYIVIQISNYAQRSKEFSYDVQLVNLLFEFTTIEMKNKFMRIFT